MVLSQREKARPNPLEVAAGDDGPSLARAALEAAPGGRVADVGEDRGAEGRVEPARRVDPLVGALAAVEPGELVLADGQRDAVDVRSLRAAPGSPT